MGTELMHPLDGLPRYEDCECRSCQVKKVCLQKVMTLIAWSSPGLFEKMETWVLGDNDEQS